MLLPLIVILNDEKSDFPMTAAINGVSTLVTNEVTTAPNDAPNFTAMWPSPPSPTTPSLWPLPTFQ